MLNSFYGKFALRTESRHKIPKNPKGGQMKFETSEIENREGIYIPVSCFATAYARKRIIDVGNALYPWYCYSDTDSIHCVYNDEVERIINDVTNIGNELCDFDIESYWTDAKFVRAKTYIEHLTTGEWNVKCAGMDDATRKYFLRGHVAGTYEDNEGNTIEITEADIDDWKEFGVGLSIKGTKLKPKRVKGGVILVTTDFEIKSKESYFR